jgi:hypothetical protein
MDGIVKEQMNLVTSIATRLRMGVGWIEIVGPWATFVGTVLGIG